jgi:hypothetical protein
VPDRKDVGLPKLLSSSLTVLSGSVTIGKLGLVPCSSSSPFETDA